MEDIKEISLTSKKKVKINGQLVEYRLPSMFEQIQFEKFREQNIENPLALVEKSMEYLVGLGFPKNLVENFSFEDFKKIADLISPESLEKKS